MSNISVKVGTPLDAAAVFYTLRAYGLIPENTGLKLERYSDGSAQYVIHDKCSGDGWVVPPSVSVCNDAL